MSNILKLEVPFLIFIRYLSLKFVCIFDGIFNFLSYPKFHFFVNDIYPVNLFLDLKKSEVPLLKFKALLTCLKLSKVLIKLQLCNSPNNTVILNSSDLLDFLERHISGCISCKCIPLEHLFFVCLSYKCVGERKLGASKGTQED